MNYPALLKNGSPYCEKHQDTPYDSSCRACFDISTKDNRINGIYMVAFKTDNRATYIPCIVRIEDLFEDKRCSYCIDLEFTNLLDTDNLESLVKEAREVVNKPGFNFELMTLAQRMK